MHKTTLHRFLILSTIASANCYDGVGDPDTSPITATEHDETTASPPTSAEGGLGDDGPGLTEGGDVEGSGGDEPGDTAAEPPGGTCSAETCAGCCDDDVCRTGDQSAACGQAGAACRACGSDEVCDGVECVEVCSGEGSECQSGSECCSDVCDDGRCTAPDGCLTCEDLGHGCGDWSDGCGGKIHCGSCDGNDACVGGVCECQPKTCGALGKQCGQWNDGCGGVLKCGSCPENYDCEAGVCEFGCDQETFNLFNWMPDASVYSVKCNQILQEISVMYVCESPDNCTQAVPYGGYATYNLSWGANANLTGFCCHVDGTTCFDQQWECNVDGQIWPCICTEVNFQVSADTCPSEDLAICN